jgi:hypothetical protein
VQLQDTRNVVPDIPDAPRQSQDRDSPAASSLSIEDFVTLLFRAGTTSMHTISPGGLINRKRDVYILQFRRIKLATHANDAPTQMRRLKELILLHLFLFPEMQKDDKEIQSRDISDVLTWGTQDTLNRITVEFVETYIERRRLARVRQHQSPARSLHNKINALLREGLIKKAYQLIQQSLIAAVNPVVKHQLEVKLFPQRPDARLLEFPGVHEDLIPSMLQPNAPHAPTDNDRRRFTNANVRLAIRKMVKRTNPGLFGFRTEHLKALAMSSARSSDAFVEEWAIYQHNFFYGFYPLDFIQLLGYVSLLTLQKPKEVPVTLPSGERILTPDIRPICMVNTEVKQPTSTAIRNDLPRLRAKLKTRSTGVMQRGTEFISHLTRVTLLNPLGHVFTVDRENAYGLSNRFTLYKAQVDACPDWQYHLTQVAQTTMSLVTHDSERLPYYIDMVCGVPQGGPPVPVQFSLADLPLVSRVNSLLSNHGTRDINAGSCNSYIDDSTGRIVSMDLQPLLSATAAIFDGITSQGGRLNPAKSYVYFGSGISTEAVTAARATIQAQWDMDTELGVSNLISATTPPQLRGITTLGVPHGHRQYIEAYVEKHLVAPQSPIQRELVNLASDEVTPQPFWLFFKHVLQNKPMHMMRGIHPDIMTPYIERYQDQLFSLLASKMQCQPFSPPIVQRMRLQFNKGGLGMQHPRDVCLAAYLASSIQFLCTLREFNEPLDTQQWEQVELLPLLQEYLDAVAECKPEVFPDTAQDLLTYLVALPFASIDRLQDKLSLALRLRRYSVYQSQVLPALPTRERNAFELLAAGDSSWLDAIPVGDCVLNASEFTFAFRSRYRLPHPRLRPLDDIRCFCRSQQVDADHLMTCRRFKAKEQMAMHNAVIQFFHACDQAAFLPSIIEPRGTYIATDIVVSQTGSRTHVNRYCDLFSGDGHLNPDGLASLSDVSCTYGLTAEMARTLVPAASIGQAVRARCAKKIQKYDGVVSRLGYRFRPLVVDSLSGIVGDEVLTFLRQRSKLIAVRLGVHEATVFRHWRIRLACLLRRHHFFVTMERAGSLLDKRYPLAYYNRPAYVDMHVVGWNPQFPEVGD